MTRFRVFEMYRKEWREFAVLPAVSPESAIERARKIGMRPKEREMKASVLKVTKR